MRSNHEVMKSVSYRLLHGEQGPSSPAASPPKPVSSQPQTKADAAQTSGLLASAPSFVPAKEAASAALPQNHPTPPPFPPSANDNMAPPQPSGPKREDEVQNAYQGPSLRGNAEGLREAREFLQGATQGRSNPRAGRERLLNQERSGYGNDFSARSSSAMPSMNTGSSAASATPRGGPMTRSQPGSVAPSPAPTRSRPETYSSGLPSYATPPARAPASQPDQVPPQVQGWGHFAANPTAKKAEKAVEEVTTAFQKVQVGNNNANTAPPTKPADPTKPAANWQMADITNTLSDRAVRKQVPPHLRSKAGAVESKPPDAAATAAEYAATHEAGRQSFKTATKGLEGSRWNPAAADKPSVGAAEVKPVATKAPEVKPDVKPFAATELEVKPVAAKDHEVKPVAKETMEKPEVAKEVIAKPQSTTKVDYKPPMVNGVKSEVNGNGTQLTNGNTTKFVTQDGASDSLSTVVSGLCKRIAALEAEIFAMQKQLETTQQAEERRKFLGTDSAKAPFGIDVQCRNTTYNNIQVSAGLKVSELIRRVRTKADLSPAATPNPRISVGGEQAGHGMTLAELGVLKDKKVMVVFAYDDAAV